MGLFVADIVCGAVTAAEVLVYPIAVIMVTLQQIHPAPIFLKAELRAAVRGVR